MTTKNTWLLEILDSYEVVETSHLHHHEHDKDKLKAAILAKLDKAIPKKKEAIEVTRSHRVIGADGHFTRQLRTYKTSNPRDNGFNQAIEQIREALLK